MQVWLDDERPCPEGWVHVKTATEAIALLAAGNIEEISLDHDLGTKETGYDVALFIEHGAYDRTLPRLKWSLHTASPVGLARMQSALMNAERYWDDNS
jgi:hypothetical protein